MFFCLADSRHKGTIFKTVGKNLTGATLLFVSAVFGQDSGNANYGNNRYVAQQQGTFPVTVSSADEMTITIRGIYNERATGKIATFSVLQVGITAEETISLMDGRIAKVIAEVHRVIGDGPTYVTYDIDGLDPAFAIGTGVPEPGVALWTVVGSVQHASIASQ